MDRVDIHSSRMDMARTLSKATPVPPEVGGVSFWQELVRSCPSFPVALCPGAGAHRLPVNVV